MELDTAFVKFYLRFDTTLGPDEGQLKLKKGFKGSSLYGTPLWFSKEPVRVLKSTLVNLCWSFIQPTEPFRVP